MNCEGSDGVVVSGSKDGVGGGDLDPTFTFRFGRRISSQAPWPFTERQYVRLLIVRSRIHGACRYPRTNTAY